MARFVRLLWDGVIHETRRGKRLTQRFMANKIYQSFISETSLQGLTSLVLESPHRSWDKLDDQSSAYSFGQTRVAMYKLPATLDGIVLRQVRAVRPHAFHARYSPPSDTSLGENDRGGIEIGRLLNGVGDHRIVAD